MCTLNTAPFQGIHIETENDKVKELIVNNFLKQSEGNELSKRSELPFPPEFLDLKGAIKSGEDVTFSDPVNIELLNRKLFTSANSKSVGWGVKFDQEFEGLLRKVSMCGD